MDSLLLEQERSFLFYPPGRQPAAGTGERVFYFNRQVDSQQEQERSFYFTRQVDSQLEQERSFLFYPPGGQPAGPGEEFPILPTR